MLDEGNVMREVGDEAHSTAQRVKCNDSVMKSVSQRVDWLVYLVIQRTSIQQSESSLWPRVKSGLFFNLYNICKSAYVNGRHVTYFT